MLTECVTPSKPTQHPYAHGPTAGQVFTPEESLLALKGRPNARLALLAAFRWGEIRHPHVASVSEPTVPPWKCADIRLLRIHGLVRVFARHVNNSARLRLTEAGYDVVMLDAVRGG